MYLFMYLFILDVPKDLNGERSLLSKVFTKINHSQGNRGRLSKYLPKVNIFEQVLCVGESICVYMCIRTHEKQSNNRNQKR